MPDDTNSRKPPDANSYRAGYGKPPVSTQFAKSRSGNPKGRPKNRKKLGTLFDQVCNEKVVIHEGGSERSMTKGEVVVRALMIKAMKGDARATAKLLDLAMRGGEFERDMSQNIMKIVLVKPKPPS
jgi:Family of unknown function (DUF5681)